MERFLKHAPIILFNENETLFPRMVGYTIFKETKDSDSMQRKVYIDNEKHDFAVEYAIYWDYDIQHLYELEHVWVYVKDGKLVDCEISFHGGLLHGLRLDRTNIVDERPVLYSQPGKHGFSPYLEHLKLLLNYESSATENDGNFGLLVNHILEGRIESSKEIDDLVNKKLSTFKFVPSENYKPYFMDSSIYTTWEDLNSKIPEFINEELENIFKEYK